ncbi:hypothetical protein AB4Z34_05325 [Ensifer sp. 2YAB10]|uniref:hypothetical protein n=1 Tax=unclassified Ensifer TaxID=2633371 RepID=UPI003F8FFF86
MPRTGGVYSPPAGTKGTPNTTIQSVPYNTFIDDLTADANAARPVTAGGTGATSASGARTALGVEIGTNVQAYDAGLQSIAGLTTVANQMLYTTGTDLYATTALTPFARTILDDADAATMKATLGLAAVASSGSASDLTTGTIADARLPTTMTGKTFSGAIAGTSLSMSSDILTTGSNVIIRGNSNRHLWFQTAAGVSRGLVYNEVTDNSIRFNLYNSSGVFVRNLAFRESDGLLTIQGGVDTGTGAIKSGDITASRGDISGVLFLGNQSGGGRYLYYNTSGFYELPGANLRVGSATIQTDGNIVFSGGMTGHGVDLYNALINKVTVNTGDAGTARYLKQNGTTGGVNMVFNWNGQGGQPNWLWGGNDGTNHYVYNPSNFNVNYANSAGNADTVDGYHESAFPKIYTGTGASDTNLSVGSYVLAYHNGSPANNTSYAVYLIAAANGYTLGVSASTQLSGTWRCRGALQYSTNNYVCLMQRVG